LATGGTGSMEPARDLGNVTADRALVRRDLRMQEPIVVEVLNPWSAFWTSFQLDEPSRSDRAAGMVAGYYDSDHLKSHRMLWWHLSDASLTIWVTRHWTTDEIITGAAALARAQPNSSAHK